MCSPADASANDPVDVTQVSPNGEYHVVVRFVRTGVAQTVLAAYPGRSGWTDPEGKQLRGSPMVYHFARKACERQLNQVCKEPTLP
eukprot:6091263-Pyramimonas_sp.AAC.1